MSSNIDIKKICSWCGKEFIAHKTTTTCCSHKCVSALYKKRKREEVIKVNNQFAEKIVLEKPIKMMTHRNVSTTQIYAELVNSKKRESANKISLK